MIAVASVALVLVFFLASGQNRRARRYDARSVGGLANNVLGFVLAAAALVVLGWWAVEAFGWLFSPAGWAAAEWVTSQY